MEKSVQMLTSRMITNAIVVAVVTKEVCPSWARFFGLTTEYINDVYESIFLMKMHGNWNFFEIYALPVRMREWFIRRTTKYFEEKQKQEQS